jgi:protein O-GlcNAc transferase
MSATPSTALLAHWFNQGNAQKRQGLLQAALASYREALTLAPQSPEVNFNLGNLLCAVGDKAAAYPHLLLVANAWPQFAPAHSQLGVVLESLGQFDAAIASHQTALRLAPQDGNMWLALSNTLLEMGDLPEAESRARRATELAPDAVDAWFTHCRVMQRQGRLGEALALCQRALARFPLEAKLHMAAGNICRLMGQADASIAAYRQALVIAPTHPGTRSNLLFMLAYSQALPGDAYLDEAKLWQQCVIPAAVAAQARRVRFQRAPRRDPQSGQARPLRVGYLSGDLCTHAVSYFVTQLFAAHDPSRVTLYAYANNPVNDAVTQKLQTLVPHWRSVTGLSETSLLETIRADNIDVLIDLSGHTAHNRLITCALRAAPVQAHYLGYFASTGLAEMDYWIGDKVVTPPHTQVHFSETLWPLPRVWVSYDGRLDAPDVADPCEHGDRESDLCLGSFNNIAKITPGTVALWARVLHALPHATLLLKTNALDDAGQREGIAAAFHQHGIDATRLDLQGNTPDWASHMALYRRVDIALDPIGGVGGGTTTCDALWMGVPVVTLMGGTMAQRMTASMLQAIGHPNWIAVDEDGYVAKVVALANDPLTRQRVRAQQRATVQASSLCDAAGLARSLEDAYEAMFDRWHEGKMPAQFAPQVSDPTASI